jgi:single stranded DNA-binding protein
MASFNKITIIGYLGRDPELRYTPQGTALCKLSVPTTERRKNAAGESEEHTTWFRITVWGVRLSWPMSICREAAKYISKDACAWKSTPTAKGIRE